MKGMVREEGMQRNQYVSTKFVECLLIRVKLDISYYPYNRRI